MMMTLNHQRFILSAPFFFKRQEKLQNGSNAERHYLIYGLCGFTSLKPVVFHPGVILPSGNISALSGDTVVVTTVGMLLASSGYRMKIRLNILQCKRHLHTNYPGPDVNSTETGKPCSKPMGWVAGLSLRNLIPCPLKHPLCIADGRSSLIYMCEVISFQTQKVLVGGGGLFFSSRILLLKENLQKPNVQIQMGLL